MATEAAADLESIVASLDPSAVTATELARNVHTHPTLSEALQEAIHGLAGHMINF